MDSFIGTIIGILVGGCPLLLVLVGVGIGWWILSGKPAADARLLQNKFASLGSLKGRTRAEIEQVVGKPKSWAVIGENRVSCSWCTQKYYITLIFDGEICEGISNEISV